MLLSEKGNRNILQKWVPLKSIPANFIYAILSTEDSSFFKHHGIIASNMKRALILYLETGGNSTYGFSTISQQTAKNMFLYPSRSVFRKCIEAYFTCLLELIWGKERILEVYLNIIQLGQGIYGIEAASQHFFKKPAIELADHEACLIALCVTDPLEYKIDNPPDRIAFKSFKLNQSLKTYKPYTKDLFKTKKQ